MILYDLQHMTILIHNADMYGRGTDSLTRQRLYDVGVENKGMLDEKGGEK